MLLKFNLMCILDTQAYNDYSSSPFDLKILKYVHF